MASGAVVVFGGTGFLGRRIVARLRRDYDEVRAAARHAFPVSQAAADDVSGRVVSRRASILDEAATSAATSGCCAVVNAVGLYAEEGEATFRSVHVDGAERLARIATGAGVARLIHVSGIGADPRSRSGYVRARAEGEARAKAAFPGATILRPSVMFGPGDSFLNALDRITRLAPAIPLFGDGGMRLQPVFVDDVAEAVARALRDPATQGKTIELGGPEALTYRAIIERLLAHKGRRRALVPLPFPAWRALARLGSVLPRPPITTAQVVLMSKDNVVDPAGLTLEDLGIRPRSLQEIMPTYL